MRKLASTFTIALGLVVLCCAAAQKQNAEPIANPDSHSSARNNVVDDGDRSSASSAAVPPSESKMTQASGRGDDNPPSAERKDENGVQDCQKSSADLMLTVDRKTVNLEEGRLQAKMAGPLCSLVMRITRKDGLPAVEKTFRYTGPEQQLRWPAVPREQIEKIEVRITAKNNAYQAATLVFWSAKIDHKEVQFDTDKSDIRNSEVASLNESLAKIKEILADVEGKGFGQISLFIAGHTDTRGSEEHNMTLSRNRAQAIAAWFMKRGLCVPIAFDGFGETVPRKMTGDEVDEPANRRVDYILAVEPPAIGKGVNPVWKLMGKGC